MISDDETIRADIWYGATNGTAFFAHKEADTNVAYLSIPLRLTERAGNREGHIYLFDEYAGTMEEAMFVFCVEEVDT